MSEMKIIEKSWFGCSNGTVGVIFAFDPNTEKYHGYVGIAKEVGAETDAQGIIDFGCQLTQKQTFEMIRYENAREIILSIPNDMWKDR